MNEKVALPVCASVTSTPELERWHIKGRTNVLCNGITGDGFMFPRAAYWFVLQFSQLFVDMLLVVGSKFSSSPRRV